MPQNTFYGIDTPFCCSRKTHTTAEQKPYAASCHYHDAYELFLFLNGKAAMYYDEEYHTINPGDLYIIPPDIPHGAACYDSKVYDRLVINVHTELLKELSTKQTDLTGFLQGNGADQIRVVNLNAKMQKRLIQLVEEISQLQNGESVFGTDIEMNAKAALLLVELNRILAEYHAQTGKKSRPKLVASIVDYVAEHLTEPITLEMLANELFISSKYISSVFRKNMGMTLREYIITKRVENAKKLLSEGKNVSEACELSGFGDYSNFIRTFTQIAGISPGKYARQQMNGK